MGTDRNPQGMIYTNRAFLKSKNIFQIMLPAPSPALDELICAAEDGGMSIRIKFKY